MVRRAVRVDLNALGGCLNFPKVTVHAPKKMGSVMA